MKHYSFLFLLTLFLFVFLACEKDDEDVEGCTDPDAVNFDPDADTDDGSCEYPPENASVTINLLHEVDGEPVELNQMIYENEAGNIYEIERLRYFVTDFAFHNEDGEIIDGDNIHLRNIREDETEEFVLEENLLPGNYEKVSFIFGLDEDKNQHYKYSDNQAYQQMEWPEPMGGGYHYMQMEGHYYADSESDEQAAFNTHTGRVVYQNQAGEDSASHDNYFIIEFDEVNFEIEDGEHVSFDVVMDINQWYENPETYNFSDYNGIMGNQNAQEILKENGKNAFRLDNLEVN